MVGQRTGCVASFCRWLDQSNPIPSTSGFTHSSIARLATAVGICLVFSLGLIGRMPFWLAVTVFVTSFVLLFEWQDEPTPRRVRRIAAPPDATPATPAADAPSASRQAARSTP